MSNKIVSFIASMLLTAMTGLGLLTLVPAASGHDLPSDVLIRAFVKPQDDRLVLLVRVPMSAMRDVRFPESGPGYLDLGEADGTLHDAALIWIAQEVELYEGEQRLADPRIRAVRVSLPSDRSFGSFDAAYGLLTGPDLPGDTLLVRDQALLDALIEYRIDSGESDFSIRTGFARLGLRTTTVLRFVTAENIERPFEFRGDPGLVRLDPGWGQAFLRFLRLGFDHILDGLDHLLFLLCLIIPFRQIRPLVVIVTSFTVAHSITLAAAAFGFAPTALWFPPLIETLIAASIVYMAIENVIGTRWQRRWIMAFGFGLVHGFGFSFALSETMQFAGSHLVTALLAFNLGVEFGQILVILIAAPLVTLLFRNLVPERIGTIVFSVLIAHTGWHWMTDRATGITEYQWQTGDLSAFAIAARWVFLLLIVVLAAWLMHLVYRRFMSGLAGSDQ